MQFIVYIAVLLVSISSILLELDWLTKPTVATKSAVHSASAPPPAAPQVVAKADRPAAPSPVTATETSTTPSTPAGPATAAVETTGKAEPTQPTAQTQSTSPTTSADAPPPPTQNDVKQANVNPTPAAPEAVHTTASNPPSAPPEQASASVDTSPATDKTSMTGTGPKRQCDVSACAAAYRSFRESDCTYQPLEGARRACVAPPSAQQRSADRGQRREADPRLARAARDPDRSIIGWRATSRMRGPFDYTDDDDYDAPRPPGRIITIDRGYGRWP